MTVTGRATPSAHVDDDTAARYEPPALALIAVFVAAAIGLTFPNLSRLHTFIPGDSGDSILNLWIMRSVQHNLPHGWGALWSPGIFHPASNTLAYSDTLLPVALVHWPLRLLFGDVLAFNLIELGAWVLSSWCAYRLARRVTSHWVPAFVASFVYTYAALRIGHQSHFQLVVGGALVPLTLLCLVRALEARSRKRGVLVGLTFAATTLTASYYGTMLAVVVVIVAAGWWWLSDREHRRAIVGALVATAIVIAALVGPVAMQYVRLQRHAEFRRGFDPAAATHPSDFLAAPANDYVLRHVPVIGPHSTPTSGYGIENRLYPGLVAIVFGIVGIVVIAGECRRRGWRVGRARELLLFLAAGAVCLLLSFGDWIRVAGHRIYLPFVAFRHLVPGFAGIRAVARLSLAEHLAVVLLVAVGLDFVVRRVRSRAFVAAIACLCIGVVGAEGAIHLQMARVPATRDDGGVSAALRARPKGVVVELPIASAADGAVWPFTESPRQYLALHDGDPRVNGYSGFQPKDYDTLAKALNAFPSPTAMFEIRRLGIRYVVLRTKLPGSLTPSELLHQAPFIGSDGVGVLSDETARGVLDAMPAGTAKAVVPVAGGYVVDLG